MIFFFHYSPKTQLVSFSQDRIHHDDEIVAVKCTDCHSHSVLNHFHLNTISHNALQKVTPYTHTEQTPLHSDNKRIHTYTHSLTEPCQRTISRLCPSEPRALRNLHTERLQPQHTPLTPTSPEPLTRTPLPLPMIDKINID